MGLINILVMAVKVTVLVITVFQSVSGQETCGGVGGVRGESNARTNNNFYINNVAPAACSGYINSFSFCYHRPAALSNMRYIFSFALYRQSTTSEGTYNNVSRTFVVEKTLSDIQSELGNDNFICMDLPVSESVPVEAWDVLGACVYDPPGNSVSRLDIVSSVADGDENVLRGNSNVCSPNTVPSSITLTQLSRRRFLNLQAEIVPPTEPPPTVGMTTISETTPFITDTTTMNVPPTIATTAMVTLPATATTVETETTPLDTETTTLNVPPTIATTIAVAETTPLESETTPLNTDTTTVNGLSTTVSIETNESSTNTTGAPAGGGNGNGGAVAAAVIVVLILLVVSAVIVVLVVLLVKKQKSTKRHYSVQTTGGIQYGIEKSDGPAAELESNTAYGVSTIEEAAYYETVDSVNAMEPTLTKISDGPAVELVSNTAYGVSRDMNSRQFEEATCYETIDKENPANTTLTEKSAEPAVELESNAAYGVSRFGEAFYETIDSDNPANSTLTRASPAGGVVTNLQDNEAYGVSSGVG